MSQLQARRYMRSTFGRLAGPRVGTTKDNQVIVMLHPAAERVPKFEDTSPLPLDKPRTAEEVARKILKERNLDGVEVENHFHARTLPGPDGEDVTTLDDLFPHGQGTQQTQTRPVSKQLADMYQGVYRQFDLHNWRHQNYQESNKPGIVNHERDPEK